MCTVTFIPSANSGFFLTSNRDESISRRKAMPPRKFMIGSRAVFYPKDMEAGGTWIATSGNNTLCLLNGAFQPHHHQPPYKRSRGLVLLDFFKWDDIRSFADGYDFEGIEPFTLVIVNSEMENSLFELRWDENEISFKELNREEAHIWSSVTLYKPEVISQRRKWFEEFMNTNSNPQLKDIMLFHESGGSGDVQNDYKMDRGFLRTVSITGIEKSSSGTGMVYNDLENRQISSLRII